MLVTLFAMISIIFGKGADITLMKIHIISDMFKVHSWGGVLDLDSVELMVWARMVVVIVLWY